MDRDGVINEIVFHQEMGIIETPFTVKQFRLRPGVAKAIRQINRLGFKTIVVSNQPGLAMRHFSRKILSDITNRMIQQLRKEKARIDAVFYCPHHPSKGTGALRRRCTCRKPKAGLLFQAARQLNINLKKSYMVGDSIFDIQAGRRAGCKTLLLGHLKCDLCHLMARRGIEPHYLVKNLSHAAGHIRRLEQRLNSR